MIRAQPIVVESNTVRWYEDEYETIGYAKT